VQFGVQLCVDEPILIYNWGQMFHLRNPALHANLEEIQCKSNSVIIFQGS